MQPQGIASEISRHLSSLRMNSSRKSISGSTSNSIPPPSPLDETMPNDQKIEPCSNILSSSSADSTLDESFDPLDPDSYPSDLISPGIDMIRVTRRKRIKRTFKLSLPDLVLSWNSKEKSKLEIDKIQSIRVGDSAKNYREEFNVSSEFNDLWITVIYISSNASHSINPTSNPLCNDLKALHMIAPTRRNYDIMLKTLTLLSKWSKDQESLLSCANINDFSKNKWNNKIKKIDRDVLSFEDVLKLTTELHIYMDISYLKSYFEECSDDGIVLNFKQFQKFVSKLRYRPELISIFNNLNVTNGKMELSHFKKFIKEIQLEDYNDEFISALFEKFSHNGNNTYLKYTDFSSYLHSANTKPLHNEEKLDSNYYSYPLTDYFISSSHNTYLLGKQFHGFSSIEGYIHVLQRGCRCIEIDIWDGSLPNSKEQYPIVTHGRTLTNSIDFETVIDIIRKYAFISSPYPLIISLEIRCSTESQIKSVNIMKSIFGNMMIIFPINDQSYLPSPNDLKHKILIKVKKSKSTKIMEPSGSSNSVHSQFSTPSTHSSSSTTVESNDESSVSSTSPKGETTITTKSNLKKMVSRSTTKTSIVPELTSLAPYFVGTKFRNFSLPESKTFNHVFSFSDRTLSSLLKDETKLIAILKHNRRGMMRIYPSVVRFRSDNYNPITFWELGCQMVATNWQIWDSGQEISEAFFESIGSGIGYTGYRLKPKTLRKLEMTNNDTLKYDKEKIKLQNLNSLIFDREHEFSISIISGQQLPRPKDLVTPNSNGYTPWVELEVYNVKPTHAEILHMNKTGKASTIDTVEEEMEDIEDILNYQGQSQLDDNVSTLEMVKPGSVKLFNVESLSSNTSYSVLFKTRFAENTNNAFSPRWNTSCRLKYLSNSNELTFIRIIVKTLKPNKAKTGVISKVGHAVVKNNNNEYTIGSWCCKIGDLKHGYRHIRLGDNKGEELIYSSLFIKVDKA